MTRNLERIEGTIPVMLDLADNDLQRGALGALGYRAVSWRLGIAQLAQSFATRAQLLRDAIDGNQVAMANAIDRLSNEHARARAPRLRAVREHALRHLRAASRSSRGALGVDLHLRSASPSPAASCVRCAG